MTFLNVAFWVVWKAIILSCWSWCCLASLASIYHTYLLGLKLSSAPYNHFCLFSGMRYGRKEMWNAVQCRSFYYWLGNTNMIAFALSPLGNAVSDGLSKNGRIPRNEGWQAYPPPSALFRGSDGEISIHESLTRHSERWDFSLEKGNDLFLHINV